MERINEIDIRSELEQFRWHNERRTPDRFIASSPFRYDRTPSFFVDLRAGPYYGCWHDSSATDTEWSGGNFPKLLAYLMDITYGEAVEYLLTKYAPDSADSDHITLNLPQLLIPESKRPLDIRILDEFRYRHPYLESRGISEAAQRLMRIGYDRKRNAVVLPWFLPDGTLGNVKFRRVDEKTFWYYRGGRPIREMLYGLNVMYERRIKRALIVESETCAMYAMSNGFPAIANGGSEFGEYKAEMIRKSPIEELLIATDNDGAGEKLRQQIKAKLTGYIKLADVRIPDGYKDVNDVRDTDILTTMIDGAEVVKLRAMSIIVGI